MKNVILIIAPHADDEVLGCGGSIVRFSEEGHDVIVVVMTNASVGAPEIFSADSISRVRAEALDSHKLLGVKETLFLDLPGPQLDQYPSYRISDAIAALIKTHRPDTLLVPHHGDLHVDHRVVFDAALVAARPQNGMSVRKILAYETLSETDWVNPTGGAVFAPNYYVGLTEQQLETKLNAMNVFKSQLREFPHPRSLVSLEALARLRGGCVGRVAAEAYVLVRSIQ
jgi:LmbE family N-acetylglucosaminyl deacetylase